MDHPPLVFYDSPTAGLDPVTSQTIITLILRGRDLQGVTSLLATHRVQDAFGLANFRFDKASGHVVALGRQWQIRIGGSLAEREKAAEGGKERNAARPTNVLVLRDGRIYFEGARRRIAAHQGRVSEKISGFGGMRPLFAISEEARAWRNASN